MSFAQVLSAVGLFRDLSWSLACPVYCGGSSVPFFGLGFSVGLVAGLVLALCAIRALGLRIVTASDSSCPVDLSPRPVRRSHRRSGYLHE